MPLLYPEDSLKARRKVAKMFERIRRTNLKCILALSIASIIALAIDSSQAFTHFYYQESIPASSGYTYVVQPGDTWTLVARLTGASIENLREANPQANRANGWLMQGEELFIPTFHPPTIKTHLVQESESWRNIADVYGVPLRLLLATNSRHVTSSLVLPAGVELMIFVVLDDVPMTEGNAQSLPGSVADMETEEAVARLATVKQMGLGSEMINAEMGVAESTSSHPVRTVQLSHNGRAEIVAFQVTQGIQTDAHDVPLVAGKPLMVRVAARSLDSAQLPVIIQATLDNLKVITNTQISNVMPDLDSEDTITMVSHYWPWQSLTASIQIYSADDPTHLLAETKSITYPVLTTRSPQIFYYPIDFPERTKPMTSTMSSSAAVGMVKGILPVADNDDFYREVPYNTFYCPVVDIGPNGKGPPDGLIGLDHQRSGLKITAPSEMCAIFHHLYSIRNALVACGYGPDELTMVYGWTDGNPMPGVNGYASQNGAVAFGNSETIRGQRTFVHEILHNLGFEHENEQIGDAGWDVEERLLHGDDIWGANQVVSAYKPSSFFDIMEPAKETAQAWVAANTYRQMFTSLDRRYDPQQEANQRCLNSLGETLHFVDSTPTAVYNVCITTNPSQDGDYYAYPFPLTMWPWSIPPVTRSAEATELFTVTVTTMAGEVFATQVDGRVGTDPTDTSQDLRNGFLHASLPYDTALGSIASISITDPEGDPVLIYNRISGDFTDPLVNPRLNSSPEVVITSPISGSLVGPEFTVSWDVVGVTKDQLRDYEFQILYSHNEGGIWTPLAVNLPGFIPEVTLNGGGSLCSTVPGITTVDDVGLEGSTENLRAVVDLELPTGILRVLGSDGFNTGSDEVRISLSGTFTEYCIRGPVRDSDVPSVE